jgi:hypothetical protein
MSPMRRLGRWMINALTVFSALGCAALITYRFREPPREYLWLVTRVPYSYHGVTVRAPAKISIRTYDLIYLDPDRRLDLEVTYTQAVFVTAILPAVWLAARCLPKRRRASIACQQCDYDLTGNVSGVCPECGTAVNGM